MRRSLYAIILLISGNAQAAYLQFTYTSDDFGTLGSFYIDETSFYSNIGSPYDGYVANEQIDYLDFEFNGITWDTDDVAIGGHYTIFTHDGGATLPIVQGGHGQLVGTNYFDSIVLYADGTTRIAGGSLMDGSWSTASVASLPNIVPIPAAIWLLGSGLGLLGWLRRKNRC